VTVQNGVFKPMKFQDMLDPKTGKTKVRLVDIDTESYKIARRYMLRLRKDDFDNPDQVAKLAKTLGLSVDDLLVISTGTTAPFSAMSGAFRLTSSEAL